MKLTMALIAAATGIKRGRLEDWYRHRILQSVAGGGVQGSDREFDERTVVAALLAQGLSDRDGNLRRARMACGFVYSLSLAELKASFFDQRRLLIFSREVDPFLAKPADVLGLTRDGRLVCVIPVEHSADGGQRASIEEGSRVDLLTLWNLSQQMLRRLGGAPAIPGE